MTANKAAKWRKAPVLFPDGEGPTGYHYLNLAVYGYRPRDDGKILLWCIMHQPSGLMAGESRTLRGARAIVENAMQRFGPEVFDQLADRDGPGLDRETFKAAKRAMRVESPS